MKKIIIILIILTFFAGTVSADYQPSIEQGALNSAISDGGKLTSMFGWDWTRNDLLVAIYESSEHHNQLLGEQNRLIENQTHAIWVQTCYRNTGIGNITQWQAECANAGYLI